VRLVLTQKFQAEGLSGPQLAGKLTYWTGITSMIQNLGAFFGVYGFGLLSQRVGRKLGLRRSFVLAMTSVASTFWFLRDFGDLWLVPLMGFGTLSVFGGYAIYFPELFPTRLRSTGTSFCYNVGRFVAASGPALLGLLTGVVSTGHRHHRPRHAAALCRRDHVRGVPGGSGGPRLRAGNPRPTAARGTPGPLSHPCRTFRHRTHPTRTHPASHV
jgi:MFS family permease